MNRSHTYQAKLVWTGNTGEGTTSYKSFNRTYDIKIEGVPPITGSAAPDYRGDPSLPNPENMLLASLSACHMLWYLHLCAANEIVVTAYEDDISGTMESHQDGSAEFTGATLKPKVTVKAGADMAKAHSLHGEANRLCFIARSVNFPVHHEAHIEVEEGE